MSSITQIFPHFVASVHYERWVSLGLEVEEGEDKEERLRSLYSSFEKCECEMVPQIVSHLDSVPIHLTRHLSGAWFRQLVEVAENLPLSLLLLCPLNSLGFPALYANPSLETMFDCSRSDWLGVPCPLIGTNSTLDANSKTKLQDTIFRAVPARIHCRIEFKDPVERLSMGLTTLAVVCKPLYDEFGMHRYTLCVLSYSESKPCIAADFLTSVPNMIFA